MKLGLSSVSRFRDLRGARVPGQWEKGLAWGGSPAGLGERFLALVGEAADQPSSRRARTAQDWRKTNQFGQKPWGALTPSRPAFYFSLFCQQSSCHLEAFFPQQWIFLCAVLGAGNAGSEETCDMWPFGLNESHSDLQTRPIGH